MIHNIIGILGSGQLAQLLAHRAYQLGMTTLCFSSSAKVPASINSALLIGDLKEQQDLDAFSQQVDVITIENENIDCQVLEYLSQTKPVWPNMDAVRVAQDRFLEKTRCQALDIPIVPFKVINSLESLKALKGHPTFTNAILKTRRFGYDGKGQSTVNWHRCESSWFEVSKAPSILEKKMEFATEVSQVSARSIDGQIVHYPLIENKHEAGILRTSYCPTKLERSMQVSLSSMAQSYITRLLSEFNYVGVLALELFVMKDGSLIVNEMAPRVHNSGHLTNEAFDIGQFEMHLRAVSGGKLKPPLQTQRATMHNMIGEIPSVKKELVTQANVRFYDYGKEARPGRKLGHWVEYDNM